MTKQEPVRIVTHNAGFHADDVFGVATLLLMLGDGAEAEIIRTRDEELIASGDYVLDVGSVYDVEANRFDHHQPGGAGERENGIPYAAFGLIWKKFGAQVAGDEETAQDIDERLVQFIDAGDNGVQTFELTHPSGVGPVLLHQALYTFDPVRGSEKTHDEGFAEAVGFASDFLVRYIEHAEADAVSRRIVRDAYQEADDKSLIVIEEEIPISRGLIVGVLAEYPDTRVFVRRHENGMWQAVVVSEPGDMFSHRVKFPAEWGGKRDEELEALTGIEGSVFCHRGQFMCVAQTQEGALAFAAHALKNNG